MVRDKRARKPLLSAQRNAEPEVPITNGPAADHRQLEIDEDHGAAVPAKVVCEHNSQQPEHLLRPVGGSSLEEFNLEMVRGVFRAMWRAGSTEQELKEKEVAVFGALAAIAPKDELEGMLAAQMVATHAAAMEAFRRAMLADQPFEGRAMNLAQANKLTRSYAVLLEALGKYRGKGQQTVRVEHVHVYKGGQAIVGHVEGGGRGAQEIEDQPHAQAVADAREPAMRCEDPERQTVPRSGSGW